MRPAIRVRELTAAEQRAVQCGLRRADGLTVRRSPMIAASAPGEPAPAIARRLGCDPQTVRTTLHAFEARGVAPTRRGKLLVRGSSVAHHRPPTACDAAAVERLVTLTHRSPRDFGHPTSLWTLGRLAPTCASERLTTRPVSGETIRATLGRCGIRWRRATHWIISPDRRSVQKQAGATG